jgi:hypothetical protein
MHQEQLYSEHDIIHRVTLFASIVQCLRTFGISKLYEGLEIARAHYGQQAVLEYFKATGRGESLAQFAEQYAPELAVASLIDSDQDLLAVVLCQQAREQERVLVHNDLTPQSVTESGLAKRLWSETDPAVLFFETLLQLEAVVIPDPTGLFRPATTAQDDELVEQSARLLTSH